MTSLVKEPSARQQAIDGAQRRFPDSVERRRLRTMVDQLAIAVHDELAGIAAQVHARQITPQRAGGISRGVFASISEAAMTVGMAAGGLPGFDLSDSQRKQISKIADEQERYFTAFMGQLAADEAMGLDQRLSLYGGVAGESFWRGMVGAAHSRTTIEWRLGVAEHCEDCLALAANSPYSPPGDGDNPLPTIPRNGDTRCLGNCRCAIEFEGAYEAGIFNYPGVEIVAIGGVAVDPMSPGARGAAHLYQELAERYAYHLRMDLAEPGGDHAVMANRARGELLRVAKSMGHTIRFEANRAELLEPVITARAHAYRFMHPDDLSDDLVLAVATAIGMRGIDRGTITAVREDPPTIVFDDDQDRAYRLDEAGRTLLFIEP